MARINIVVPRLYKAKFSGGIWCIFEYAHGLHKRGHDVTIVPILPSPEPAWFNLPVGRIISSSTKARCWRSAGIAFEIVKHTLRHGRATPRPMIRDFMYSLCSILPAPLSHPVQMGLAEEYVLREAPPADINIATNIETARPVSLLKGQGFYFTQHYEALFTCDYPVPTFAEYLAHSSYRAGLTLIANSLWLQKKLEAEAGGQTVALCPNAISHSVYCGKVREASSSRRIVLISYGGRDAVWKGFHDMAVAVAIARSTLSDYQIEWRVFGECLLPPKNDLAEYTPLGFLKPAELSDEYRRADILLSASWYESFPLFPLEAMASGCAVVTTPAGTEDYAIPGITAEIVEPRSPERIAAGLMRVITDEPYRLALSRDGLAKSREFTWEKSVEKFETILLSQEKSVYNTSDSK